MRLAQLARKLALKPTEITTFLADRQIPVEESSNAKVNDDHVKIVIQHFAPQLLEEKEHEGVEFEEIEEETLKLPEQPVSIEPQQQVPQAEELTTLTPASAQEKEEVKVELIKAPKVELQGLKVVGKIDLPEPKKKEEPQKEASAEEAESQSPQPQRSRDQQRREKRQREHTDRRPRKNPIAVQREREEREARRKREEEKLKEKELRTKRYMEKVGKHLPPPKPIKKRKREEEYEVYVEETPPPKTLFGKILRWLKAT